MPSVSKTKADFVTEAALVVDTVIPALRMLQDCHKLEDSWATPPDPVSKNKNSQLELKAK